MTASLKDGNSKLQLGNSEVPAREGESGGSGRSALGLGYYLSYLRSLLFTNNLIILYTVVCGALSLAGSVVDTGGRWQHLWARTWSWLILKTSGVRVRVEGLENVPRETAIYCANHQSTMDIPVLFVYLPVHFRVLAKRSLFKIPFLGWHLRRAGDIPVDRGQARRAFRSFDQAAERIRSGVPVVLFPEGTRSRDGALKPFKGGSFYLAIQARLPVVPITLNGTRYVHTPDTLHVRSGRTEMIIHPPISTAALTSQDADALSARVHRSIASRFIPPEEWEKVTGDRGQGTGLK
jgi:1-acyl-sn-glycerol-3-phosphate acyltransferase